MLPNYRDHCHHHFTKATHFIDELRSVGYRVALYNFGAEMSVFAYLKKLSVDFIKIGVDFVQGYSIGKPQPFGVAGNRSWHDRISADVTASGLTSFLLRSLSKPEVGRFCGLPSAARTPEMISRLMK